MDPQAIREEYRALQLDESTILPNPIAQFGLWFEQALAAGIREPNAMALATASPNGIPAVRMVLLKGFDSSGFVFFTNYESAKASHLDANPLAEVVLYWKELERQVRIHGTVSRVNRKESEEYFFSRPLPARIGAWASPQSRPIAARAELEQRFTEIAQMHPDGEVPLPEHWGGYRLSPQSLEFWQGRLSRLHDRIRFQKVTDRTWRSERLAP